MSFNFEINPEPGDSVTYVPDFGKHEKGVVKSLCDDKDYVFVVFHCNGEWHKYKDYTAARTAKSDLIMGWEHGT